jgi:CDP-glucose 4,6-dehydratase
MEDMEVMDDLKNHYAAKKVFITGHTGFKGSWLTQLLVNLGAIVRGYALEPEGAINLFDASGLTSKITSQYADLRDQATLMLALADFQPDYVFHLAAQPLVRLSYVKPIETFDVNVLGTAHLLEALKRVHQPCSVVLITTDKVYQNIEQDYLYNEDDRLGGYDPYSASKACCELVIDSYRNSFFSPVKYADHQKSIAVARAGNVIGGGDWSADRLIPDIARALQQESIISIRNPHSVRPWQHVLEPLMGYLELGMKITENPLEFGQAYNFGPYASDALSVEEIVQMAIQSWGSGEYVLEASDVNPHEAGLLKLSIEKAQQSLRWNPVYTAQVAVERTINWYKQFYAGKPASELMLDDIAHYQGLNHG